ncbi:MAG: bifunctional phosphoglucose/phosphomannose isomerase [bacterium]
MRETMTGRIGKDPSDMTARVLSFPEQIRGAWRLAASQPLDVPATPSRVYVVGMGGSAIGGDFVRSYAEQHGRVAVEVVRGYQLPQAVDSESFAFFVSYSGNTEETLAAWEEAGRRGVPRAVVTSGGALGASAAEQGVPRVEIPGGSPPRAALGWTSLPVFHALARAGLVALTDADVAEAATACEAVARRSGLDASPNAVREWAEALPGRLPVVYTADVPYRPVAVRWMGQINENAKTLCHVSLFPEHNHNEIVGWEVDSAVRDRIDLALLDDDAVHPRNRRRLALFESEARRLGRRVTRFAPEGRGLLARLYSFALLGDFASLWLAARLEVDPTPVASIDRFKGELERS